MLCTYKIFPLFYLLFLLFAFRDHLEAISKERPIFISHLASDVLVDVLLSYSGLLHFWEAATLSEILMKAKSPFPRNMPVRLCVRQSILCTESLGIRGPTSLSLFFSLQPFWQYLLSPLTCQARCRALGCQWHARDVCPRGSLSFVF